MAQHDVCRLGAALAYDSVFRSRRCPTVMSTMLSILERSSALNQINDQNDHSYYEQQMDQAAPHMPEKTQKPENNKNYKYSRKHKFIFGFVFPPRIVCSKPKEKLKAKS